MSTSDYSDDRGYSEYSGLERRSRRSSRWKDKKSSKRSAKEYDDSDMSSNDFAISDDFREFSGRFSGMQSSKSRSRSRSRSDSGDGVNPFKKSQAKSGKNRRLRFATAALQGIRPTMEDAMSVALDMPLKKGNASYFGVFDGHGGHSVADLLETEVPDRLRKVIKSSAAKDIKKGIHEAFMSIDADLIKDEWNLGEVVGSTALVMLVTEKEIIVGSTGDSRAVLVRKSGEPVSMTSDHKPTDRNEAMRIQRAGFTVEQDKETPGIYRVGGLAMSRSLGDTRLKKNPRVKQEEQAVIATPDVQVEKNEDVDFVVVACDGIWDVMTPTDVSAFVRNNLRAGRSLKKVARRLLVECLRRKSTDNMSVIIVLWRTKEDRKAFYRNGSGNEYSDASYRRSRKRRRR